MSTESDALLSRVRSATAGEYTLERELGRGGMAAVYLARDTALDRLVAIKVMLPDLVAVAGIQDRFVIEARTSAHLDHPGIVTVYSVKERDGLLFIVMKYIEGRTLDAILKDEAAIEVPLVAAIVGQVSEALLFAHGEGVIHRDVKPSNILIDTRGRPVVTDFGIAKVTASRSITVTGAMIGTPAYMSPEQCRGLPATAASDQYALGVMAYEILTRRLPFEGSLFELIHAHSEEPPPKPTSINPAISVEMEECVLRMLAKNPRERWPSLAEVSHFFASQLGPGRRSSDMRVDIAALARRESDPAPKLRRGEVGYNLAVAETKLTNTPAPALVITPLEPSIEIGEAIQLRVTESSGASLAGVRVVWQSEDATIATVDDTGRVAGKSVGLAKITVTAGAASGRAAVTVKAPQVDTLVVTPQSPELIVDNEVQFVATVLDGRGNLLTGQSIVWMSSDVAVCAVSQQGRAIGVGGGRATVTAICGPVRGMAQVKVRPPAVDRVVLEPGEASIEVEETVRITATVLGPSERVLAGRPVTWRSSVPTVLRVDADGTIAGLSPGTAAVIASCEGKEGLASVSVRSQPIVAVRIQPAQIQLELGRSLQLQGAGEDRRGRAVNEAGLQWHSDDDGIALVDASGKVFAVAEGRTQVHAIAENATSSIDVTVVPRPAAQVRIESHAPTLAPGEFLALDAVVLDGEGATLSGRTVAWSSSDDAIVSVSDAGVCEAKRAGAVRVTAAVDRARATSKLKVVASAMAPVVPAPPDVAKPEAEPAVPAGAESIGAAGASSSARRRAVPVAVGALALVAVVVGGIWLAAPSRRATPLATQAAPTPGDSAATAPPTAPQSPSQEARGQSTSPDVPSKPALSGGASSRGADPASSLVKGPDRKPGSATTTKDVGAPGATKSDAPGRAGSEPAKPVDTAVTGRGAAAQPPVARPEAVTPAPSGSSAPPAPQPASPAGNAEGAGGTAAMSDKDRAMLCGNPTVAVTALFEALRANSQVALASLYQPQDPIDAQAKDSLMAIMKTWNAQLPPKIHPMRPGSSAAGCNWLMEVQLVGRSVLRLTRQTKDTGTLRMQLEMSDGAVHVKRIYSFTGF